MKRSIRIASMLQDLSGRPSVLFKLQDFCDKYAISKATASEDVSFAAQALSESNQGEIITITGPSGGVKFVPTISPFEAEIIQKMFCERLNDPGRILVGGFLYTSDIMYDVAFVRDLARIFVTKFKDLESNYVVTVETKGIPLASMVAYMLNLPLVIIRREPKFSEGSTVSINYFSGPDQRVQKMSIAKRAVTYGTKAIVIDDFMRGGGSIKGIWEILEEFDIDAVATGLAIVSATPEMKKIDSYMHLVTLNDVNDNSKSIDILPNVNIF